MLAVSIGHFVKTRKKNSTMLSKSIVIAWYLGWIGSTFKFSTGELQIWIKKGYTFLLVIVCDFHVYKTGKFHFIYGHFLCHNNNNKLIYWADSMDFYDMLKNYSRLAFRCNNLWEIICKPTKTFSSSNGFFPPADPNSRGGNIRSVSVK